MSEKRGRKNLGDQPVQPLADYGYFAPDSVTHKVWSYPTSFLLGFARAVAIELLDPMLVASITTSGQVKQRTPLRYDRTMQYFATVAFGDAESVLKSSEILMKIHQRSVGTDPVTGRTYDANNPDSQLWIHLTAWHSILITYEMFGPGKLTAEEETQYWNECAIAAEFQTIDPAAVPRTREGVAAYFESYRPELIASDAAQDMFHFLVNMTSSSLPPEFPPFIRRRVNAFTSRAVLATMPHWMREMGGMPQSRTVDAMAIAAMKPALYAIAKATSLKLAALRSLSPRTYPILAPFFLGIEPANPKVYTPTEARAQFGHDKTPRELYLEQLAEREKGRLDSYGQSHHDDLLAFDTAGEHAGTLAN